MPDARAASAVGDVALENVHLGTGGGFDADIGNAGCQAAVEFFLREFLEVLGQLTVAGDDVLEDESVEAAQLVVGINHLQGPFFI